VVLTFSSKKENCCGVSKLRLDRDTKELHLTLILLGEGSVACTGWPASARALEFSFALR
jgi:hypothetical protein